MKKGMKGRIIVMAIHHFSKIIMNHKYLSGKFENELMNSHTSHLYYISYSRKSSLIYRGI